MNTLELDAILSHGVKTRDVFGGVFASNKLPKRIRSDRRLFIANTDPASQSGQHWVAFYFDGDDVCTYFDSYGLPPIKKSFLHFMERNCKGWIYNTKQLQHHASDMCGPYCLFFAYHICRGRSLDKIQMMLPGEPRLNDIYVKDFIRRHNVRRWACHWRSGHIQHSYACT